MYKHRCVGTGGKAWGTAVCQTPSLGTYLTTHHAPCDMHHAPRHGSGGMQNAEGRGPILRACLVRCVCGNHGKDHIRHGAVRGMWHGDACLVTRDLGAGTCVHAHAHARTPDECVSIVQYMAPPQHHARRSSFQNQTTRGEHRWEL